MDNTEGLQEEVVRLISSNFGDQTGKLYKTFFDKEDARTILSSARELLTELIGQRKTDEEISVICKKFHIDTTTL